jgi:hypothetical protein
MTVLVPAVLVLLLGTTELLRDSADRRVQYVNRVIMVAVLPLLCLFAYYVARRVDQIF